MKSNSVYVKMTLDLRGPQNEIELQELLQCKGSNQQKLIKRRESARLIVQYNSHSVQSTLQFLFIRKHAQNDAH